ncbi:hypothetical protein KFU94_21915 [Chloroflexi bacterium TSY]|nr:hypothetical protein [Chloroflexi bacterium TSY]
MAQRASHARWRLWQRQLYDCPARTNRVPTKIVILQGKWFPTGAHKVGAAFGCLVPMLVTGQFDPTTQKAVWPSTGNYCGAYDSNLLGCESIAILPEGMSQERFHWLAQVAGEIIKTPGSESNVKEIFDKCQELQNSGQDLVIFNQFNQHGNYLWHHEVTGLAMATVLDEILEAGDSYRGVILTTGSAGTIASGDYLKSFIQPAKLWPAKPNAQRCSTMALAHTASKALATNTSLDSQRQNTDHGIDDAATMKLIRLFNDEVRLSCQARRFSKIRLAIES